MRNRENQKKIIDLREKINNYNKENIIKEELLK